MGAALLGPAGSTPTAPAPVGLPALPATCTEQCVTTYQTPVAEGQSGPFALAAGPLDSQWFAYGDRLGRIDPAGRLSTYAVPTTPAAVGWVATLGDERLWFAERGSGRVGWLRVEEAPGGQHGVTVREYPLPGGLESGPHSLVRARDGRVYITEQDVGRIARLDPRSGRVREFTVPDGDPLGMTLGPDGALWFVQREPAKIGRMTLDGRFRQWSLAEGANPNRIVAGPDGGIWFTQLRAQRLGRIDPRTGELREHPLPGGPVGITVGRDRNLYVVLSTVGDLVRVDRTGEVTGRWDLPGATFVLQAAAGHGLDVWVSDSDGRVYRVTPYREEPAGSR